MDNLDSKPGRGTSHPERHQRIRPVNSDGSFCLEQRRQPNRRVLLEAEIQTCPVEDGNDIFARGFPNQWPQSISVRTTHERTAFSLVFFRGISENHQGQICVSDEFGVG